METGLEYNLHWEPTAYMKENWKEEPEVKIRDEGVCGFPMKNLI